MTDEQQQPLAHDRIQDKADILENNLFNQISKQGNPVVLQFQVNREQYPDPVVIKALIQLFPRINIKSSKVLIFLRQLLLSPIPQSNQIKTQKKLLDLAQTGKPELSHLHIILTAIVSQKVMAVEIKGVHPVPSQDGAIGEAFFDHETCPGLIRAGGAIDFKEINKYPIVKAGDNLFFIKPEIQGRSGIRFDGKIIPVEKARPLAFNLISGIDIVDSRDREGKYLGYFLRASKTGVVVLVRSGKAITDMEIRDALDVRRLDYSTGNIGTRFICPISMKIDTICHGFSIRAVGTVEVGELEGGKIETDSHATVDTAHPDSIITAQKDIVVRFSRHARLTSGNGMITIMDEAVDSRISGPAISFEKARGILTGNTLDSENIYLKNIYLCGKNTLWFGRRLFTEKQRLINERENLAKENQAREEKEQEYMEGLHANLVQLSKTLKQNPLLRDNLKSLIMATRTMDYPILYEELATIGQTMNTKEVTTLEKILKAIQEIPEQNRQALKKDKDLLYRIAHADKKMAKLTLRVEGFIRRAAILKIFTPEDKAGTSGAVQENAPPKPALLIESKQDKDTYITVHGAYVPGKGFELRQQ